MSDTASPTEKQDPAEIIAGRIESWLRVGLGRHYVAEAVIKALGSAGYAIVPREPTAEMIAWGAAMVGNADMTMTETGERREMDEWFENEEELQQAFLAGWQAAIRSFTGALPDLSEAGR